MTTSTSALSKLSTSDARRAARPPAARPRGPSRAAACSLPAARAGEAAAPAASRLSRRTAGGAGGAGTLGIGAGSVADLHAWARRRSARPRACGGRGGAARQQRRDEQPARGLSTRDGVIAGVRFPAPRPGIRRGGRCPGGAGAARRSAGRRRGGRGRGPGLGGILEQDLEQPVGPGDHHAVGADGLHAAAADGVADRVAEHALGHRILQERAALRAIHDDAVQERLRARGDRGAGRRPRSASG